jgi:hypothetical protein
MSDLREKRTSPSSSIQETSHTAEMRSKAKGSKEQSMYSKVSPLPRPDFSSIEKKESNFTYKQKGSYKKPKSNVPESPMKSPNQKFFTPVKLQIKNIFGANANTCRKLLFGEGGGDEEMNVEEQQQNFTETFKSRGKSFLDKLDEEDKLTSNEISPDVKKKKNKERTASSLYDRLAMDVDDARETTDYIGFGMKSFGANNYLESFGSFSGGIQMNIDIDTPIIPTKKPETKFEKEFDVIKTIDTGAFGIVFKCRSKIDDKIYAVKKSKKHSSVYDFNAAKNFISDFYLIIGIFSQFCVSYKECWLDNDARDHTLTENHLYITQEFCKYGDLLDYLEKVEEVRFKFTVDFYWDLIFEMMCGVHFLHESGYIHFDIKPGNFLIDECGCVKLGDFGLTRKSSSIKRGEDIYEGDSIYIAPEFFTTNNKVISEKVDVFSLGLTILEILCKVELPQNGKLWKTIRSENFDIPNEFLENTNIEINSKMILLMKKLLILNPEERPSILSLFQSSEFKELNIRYISLLKNQYTRFLNPKEFDNDMEEDIISSVVFGKRSNSYKINI